MLTARTSLGEPKVYNYFATAVDNCTHLSLQLVIAYSANLLEQRDRHTLS